MTSDDKKLIYNLLETADSCYYGYTREVFKQEYVFSDDKKTETIKIKDSNDISEEKNHIQQNIHENEKANGLTLESLNEKMLRCTRCVLARTRNNVVPGMGVINPLVLVIGEGPGHDEDIQGLPFVGKAGILLDKMLNAIDLDRNKNCYIANVVKCRPPENRNPSPQEMDACFSFLQTQIHILKPKMILCMGKIAIEKLMNQSISITQSHGQFFEYNGIPVMPTYHPSAPLRNTDLKRPAWEDLKKFKAKLKEFI